MPTRDELLSSAQRLHGHLLRRHYSHGWLSGPDAGIRFNLRTWRFLKSTLNFVPWRDDYLFMQTQGYWVLVNWMLYEATGVDHYCDVALEATEATLKLQNPEGFWAYPLPQRKHLIATVEGDWGSIALLATHARQPRSDLLRGAIRWYEYLVNRIAFQDHARGKAINYFDKPRGKVPNNSVEAAWLFARLWKATDDDRFLEHVDALLDFVAAVQLASGELPYVVESPFESRRAHYLCFQYNAFQFLKLAWLDALRPGGGARSLLPRLAEFLSRGVRPLGMSASDCSTASGGGPEVDYYTAVLAAALHEAAQRGLADQALSARCYARVLERQRPDASFWYSTGDYGFLSDHRSYPRPQVMTLFHLLYPMCGDGFPKNRN